MQLIKFEHACVRLEDGDRRLLIDPGLWTPPEAFEGVTDVLVTHEHADHIGYERIESVLKAQALQIFAPEGVRAVAAEQNAPAVAEAIRAVPVGDTFAAGGYTVAPARAFPIHDRMLSTDVGYGNFDAWMAEEGRTDYARIPLGQAATI